MRNNKNKHSGGVSCSACNAFMLVLSWGGSIMDVPYVKNIRIFNGCEGV